MKEMQQADRHRRKQKEKARKEEIKILDKKDHNLAEGREAVNMQVFKTTLSVFLFSFRARISQKLLFFSFSFFDLQEDLLLFRFFTPTRPLPSSIVRGRS